MVEAMQVIPMAGRHTRKMERCTQMKEVTDMFTCDDCIHWHDGCELEIELDECEDAYDCHRFEDKYEW